MNTGSRWCVIGLRVTGAVALTFFFAIAFTPFASVISRGLGQPPRLEPAAAIVVLGGGGVSADGRLSDISLRRTLYGVHLYQRRLAPLVLFSGTGAAAGPREGEARAELARAVGVPDTAILTETTARTTHEEAQRIARVLLPRRASRILLVADAQGMRRAAGVFNRAGFETLPAPAEDVAGSGGPPEARLDLARRVVMELVALVYYGLAGYL